VTLAALPKDRIDVNSTTPLIVDLDGSLLRTDSLHESLAAALGRPRVIIGAFWQLARYGKAAMKRHLAAKVTVDANLLPVNQEVVAFLRSERESGRAIYLATGADSSLAEDIAIRFPEFAGTFASDGRINLTSVNKAELLVREFGAQGFDYVGNSAADRAVWHQARAAYLVTPRRESQNLPQWADEIDFAGVIREDAGPAWWIWMKELRVHQSLKNVLLFLPILAAHSFELRTILFLSAGFVSFTLMAWSVYLLNDLLDLRSDRLHERKALRPLASGLIQPMQALVASAMLAIVSVVTALAIGVGFTVVLLLYAALTCSYSFRLKRVPLVDVTVLAMLYMIRILAGAVIATVELSFWFTGVALFLFISLALVKRYTELSRPGTANASGILPGRGYSRSDATVILPLGIGSGMAVLLLMAIYLQSSAVAVLYPSGVFLWLVIPALFYWIGNIWIQAGRGAMHDDPIVFALKNRASLISGGVIAGLFILASTHLAALAERVFSFAG
jgi:4-hydroxybenzoate polyprenyltransferase